MQAPMADLERLDALLADQEKAFKGAFLEFVAAIGSIVFVDALIERLEARDLEGAMRIIDSYIIRMADVIPLISANVGAATARELADELAENAPEIKIALGFDPSYPRAAEIARTQRLRLVRDLTTGQREAVRQIVARMFAQGSGPAEAARAIAQSVGLTAYQDGIVENYRQALISRDRNALARDLRDRRYDKQVARAIERDRPLTDQQLERMVARYRANYINLRATTLARTEGGQAFSEAREEAVSQMLEQSGLQANRMTDIWNSTRDDRTRDIHASLNGQERPRGQPFQDGAGALLRYPGDPRAPAGSRINCRCVKTFRVAPNS